MPRISRQPKRVPPKVLRARLARKVRRDRHARKPLDCAPPMLRRMESLQQGP